MTPILLVAASSSLAEDLVVTQDFRERQVVLLAPLEPYASFGACDDTSSDGACSIDAYNKLRGFYSAQMNILRMAAEHNPVAVLVTGEDEAWAMVAECAYYGTCDALAQGRAVFLQVPHDTPWIRDYAPYFYRDRQGRPVVVDAVYAMAERGRRDLRASLISGYWEDRVRSEIGGRTTAWLGTQEFPAAMQEIRTATRAFASLLERLPLGTERDGDDNVVDSLVAVLAPGENIRRLDSDLVIDGGNLLRTSDGRCLTTTDIFMDNPELDSQEVLMDLRREFACRGTVVLEPLPGEGIIKHVDMFVLPGDGRNVVLASYDPAAYTAFEWEQLDGAHQALVGEAQAVMAQNRELLDGAGFTVTSVLAPLPVSESRGGTWFPTLLNGLPLQGPGVTHVILPRYAGLRDDYLDDTRRALREAFGPSVQVDAVEATESGRGQGAVHCLTNTVPFAFADYDALVNGGATAVIDEFLETPLAQDLAIVAGDWVVAEDSRLGEIPALADDLGFTFIGPVAHLSVSGEVPGAMVLLEACEAEGSDACFLFGHTRARFDRRPGDRLRMELEGMGSVVLRRKDRFDLPLR